MLGTKERWLGLVALGCAGCASIIGLPDLPNLSTDPGASGAGTSPETGGTSGTRADAGDSSKGTSGTATAGGSSGGVPGIGGRATDGSAGEIAVAGSPGNAGTATTAGSTGTVGTAGSAGSAGDGTVCMPTCGDGMTCQAGKCQCSTGFSSCSNSNACFDLQNDKDHCGTCTGTCKDGCSVGRCFTRISALPSDTIVKFAVNATHVYFTKRDAGTVSRISRSNGAVEQLADRQTGAVGIALDANNVYWATMGAAYGEGTVMKMPLAGGQKTTLATAEPEPEHVVVDANNVYWNNTLPVPGTLMKVPIAGGDANKVVLASGDPATIAGGFTLDATNAYWGNWSGADGDVWKVPLNGGAIANLTHTSKALAALATVSGGTVYFVAGSDIRKVSTAGGTASTVYLEAPAAYMVADSSNIYVAEVTKYVVLRIPFDGSKVVPLAAAKKYFLDLAEYGSDVFWVDAEGFKSTSKTP